MGKVIRVSISTHGGYKIRPLGKTAIFIMGLSQYWLELLLLQGKLLLSFVRTCICQCIAAILKKNIFKKPIISHIQDYQNQNGQLLSS